MNEENELLIENNKLIAELIGWRFVTREDGLIDGFLDERLGIHESDPMWRIGQRQFDDLMINGFIYHKSWKKLMGVVDKIHHLKTWREDKKDLSMFSTLSLGIDFCGHSKKCSAHVLGSITFCHTENIPHTFTKIDCPGIWIHHKKTAIEATYEVVVQFIQWYKKIIYENTKTL